MHPWSIPMEGRIEEITFESRVLANNPLGDPYERPVWVYLPPEYDKQPKRRCPSIYLLQGYTGQIDMWRNRSALRKTVPELVDQLFATNQAPPCIVIWVDCWTSLGGSQFLDSPAVGRYHTYLCDELVPWIDQRYRTLPERKHRGIAGKSSGGYGAMVTAMCRPDLFGGFASHSGDALFEVCYPHDFPKVVRALRDSYGGAYENFWQDFRSRTAFVKDSDFPLLDCWAMSACYSPTENGRVELPFDLTTGALRPEVWAQWLAKDPVRIAPHCADALRSMRAIYIDCGKRDQYFLDLGAEAFRREVKAAGIQELFFELFDGTHSATEYRYPLSLKYLADRLAI